MRAGLFENTSKQTAVDVGFVDSVPRTPFLESNYLMTFGKRKPDRFTEKDVAYSSQGTFESASAKARAFAGRAERGAVKIEAANSITADLALDPAAGPAVLTRR